MTLSAQEAREYRYAIEGMCHEAGRILMKHFRNLETYEKKGEGDIDLVTIADKESEAAVIRAIEQLYPDHAILAEESGAVGEQSKEYLWIIDPLDGTTNFAHGVRNFAVSIGLYRNGKAIAGGVYAPALGEMYLAARGHGATRNGERLHVSDVATLKEALLVTGFPYNRNEVVDWLMATIGSFLTKSQGMLRLGAAALDFAMVAGGHLDGFYEPNLKPWDMAAGALLVEEAGGRMSKLDGSGFDVFADEMVASNGLIHDRMVEVIQERPVPKFT